MLFEHLNAAFTCPWVLGGIQQILPGKQHLRSSLCSSQKVEKRHKVLWFSFGKAHSFQSLLCHTMNHTPTTMASQELLFRANNGLQHLYDGNYDEAIYEFRQAVRVVSCTIKPDQEVAPEFSNVSLSSLEIEDNKDDIRIVCGEFLDHNTMYLHTSAFRLSPSPQHDHASSSSNLKNSSLAAALLYNMGLAFHLKARQRTDQELSFQKAMAAYEMAIQALRHNISQPEIPRSLCETNLFLALFTNKAHASFQFFDWNTTRHCVQVVQQLLAEAPAQGGQPVTPQEHQQHYQDWNMNVIFAEGQSTRSAPAA